MLIIETYLMFAMMVVIWFDITRYIIPNWLSASLLMLYPIAVWLSPQPVDWKMALVAMGIVFAVGYFIFMMKWMGGGDIKLLTVCSLWVGLSHLIDFLFLVALAGGAMSVVLWGVRKFEPHLSQGGRKLPRLLKDGEPVPYGVAIAVGFVLLFWMGKISIPVWR